MSSGEIVVWGKTSEETAPAFHIFSPTSAGWKKLREEKRLGDHNNVYILPITVNNKERLAVSCWRCNKIKLCNLDILQVTTAFNNPKYYPGVMSLGENGKLYVVHSLKVDKQAMELDCSEETFSGPNKILLSGMEQYHSMYYIPSPHRLIVFACFSDDDPDNTIRAVSSETGEKVWEVKGEVNGTRCDPHGLLFSPQHQTLLVADGNNCRVLVIHPRDGSVLQTIQLEPQMGSIWELCLHQNKLAVHHNAVGKEKVSYFSVS